MKIKIIFLLFIIFFKVYSEEKYSIIQYTSTTATPINPCKLSAFDGTLISNTYSDGVGRLIFRPNNGDHLTTIGDSGFVNCNDITSIIIPEGVTKIGFRCFAPSKRLYHVSLPSTLDSIDGRAFHGARLLDIDLPKGIRTLPFFCFGFSLLTHIDVPTTVTTLSTSCFECCYYLESINLPQSIQKIESYVFANCPSLHSINYAGTIAQWKAIKKGLDWNRGGWQATPIEVIHCSDGDIEQTPWHIKENDDRHETFTIEITDSEWATLCLPICTSEIPEDIKVYIVEKLYDKDSNNIYLSQVDHIIAFKPYIINGPVGQYQLSGQFYSIPESESPFLGLLNGCLKKTVLSSNNQYVLQFRNNQVGFYRINEEKPIAIDQYKAYMELTNSSINPASFRVEDNNESNINNSQITNRIISIYDTAGRQLSKTIKGINIVTFEDGRTIKIKI